jgi:hypothetical protein
MYVDLHAWSGMASHTLRLDELHHGVGHRKLCLCSRTLAPTTPKPSVSPLWSSSTTSSSFPTPSSMPTTNRRLFQRLHPIPVHSKYNRRTVPCRCNQLLRTSNWALGKARLEWFPSIQCHRRRSVEWLPSLQWNLVDSH